MILDNAADMYRGVLMEIGKTQSEDFDVEDFNYWIIAAIEKWFKNEMDQFELTQKVSDKISCLVKLSYPITLNANDTTDVREADLPDDYRHLVSCLVSLRYKTATPSFAQGAIRKEYTKRITGDGQAALMDNYYLRPLVSDADVRLYHRTLGNKVSILRDSPRYPNDTVRIKDIQVEYLMKPPAIVLNDDLTVDSDTVFPPHANGEIVKICAQLFLEENESQRLQSHTAINN